MRVKKSKQEQAKADSKCTLVRIPKDAKACLDACSLIMNQPSYKVLDEAMTLYLSKMAPADREAVQNIVERMIAGNRL